MRINGVVGVNPTHIHTGTCDDLDPNPKYPLTNIELNTTELVGTSDSVVDVPLDELLASPHLILIHKSPEDLNTYYACGNIVADTTGANVAEDSGVGAGTTDEAGASPASNSQDHGLGNMGSGASDTPRTSWQPWLGGWCACCGSSDIAPKRTARLIPFGSWRPSILRRVNRVILPG